MNIAGFLVTMANLGAFAGPGSQAKDMALRVGPLETLAHELKTLPDFPINGFKHNGYYRSGYTGKYISKNLQEYLFYGIGSPTDEGLIMTLVFGDLSDMEHDSTKVVDDTNDSAYFMHAREVGPDVKNAVNSYIESRKYLEANN